MYIPNKKEHMQALAEIKDELSLKISDDEIVSFGDLNSSLDEAISESGKKEIWQKFVAKAPFVEDKKKLFRNIASNVRKREV